ncbi:MAG: tyrosine-type recombinase/integrase [Planctomycetota bacterium]|jgi:hypothetical protein
MSIIRAFRLPGVKSSRLASDALRLPPRGTGRLDESAAAHARALLHTAALGRVGFAHVPLYESTKHSFATDAIRRGVPERLLQKFLGHAHPESTRRYARLADVALVQVLRPSEQTDRQVTDKGSRDKAERKQRDRGGPSWVRTGKKGRKRQLDQIAMSADLCWRQAGDKTVPRGQRHFPQHKLRRPSRAGPRARPPRKATLCSKSGRSRWL